MSNLNRSKIEELIAKWREEWNIFFPRWLAQMKEELKDPDKGPILREKLMNFLQSASKPNVTEDVARRQSTPATDTERQRTRRWMHMRRRVEVTITLPKYLLEAIDGLAEVLERTRSAVIETFAEYCLDNENVVDELFPR